MKKLTAEGYCGKQHTLDELEACGECKKYREIWNAAIEAAAEIMRETYKAEETNLARELWYEIRKLKK